MEVIDGFKIAKNAREKYMYPRVEYVILGRQRH
jgi:hypothetical protein